MDSGLDGPQIKRIWQVTKPEYKLAKGAPIGLMEIYELEVFTPYIYTFIIVALNMPTVIHIDVLQLHHSSSSVYL